jgi:Flp pilus assembly protein TadG
VAERGSVLMLVPAGVLVLLVLGAIAVDAAVVHLGQRQLANAVAAAANDAAAAAISDASFYGDADVEIDPDRARRIALASFAAALPSGAGGALSGHPSLEVVVAGDQVCVSSRAEVRHILSPAVPGARRHTEVTARATATAVQGDSVSPRRIC